MEFFYIAILILIPVAVCLIWFLSRWFTTVSRSSRHPSTPPSWDTINDDLKEIKDTLNGIDERLRSLQKVAEVDTGEGALRNYRSKRRTVDTFSHQSKPSPAQRLVPLTSTDLKRDASPASASSPFGDGYPDVSEQIAELYNRSFEELRMQFQGRKFGVSNMDQRRLKDVKLEYGLNDSGDYWLVEAGKQLYAVPYPRQVYAWGQFASGGMGEVFECEGYVQGYRFRSLVLTKPAVFRDLGDGRLEMAEKGTLKLDEAQEEV